MTGRLIVFEGIDGSGKSTAIDRVAAALREEGVPLTSTQEETRTWRGEAVRRSIAEGAPPLSTAFLFLADRAAHVEDIRAWLADGHVLCDRFVHSTLAYQAVALEAMEDAEAFLRGLHTPWCPWPDHVVLLRADPEACVARTRGRGSAASRYEKAAFLRRVQDRYLGLAEAEADRFTVLDADRPADEVARDALHAVRAALA